jgi:hypothetical protein
MRSKAAASLIRCWRADQRMCRAVLCIAVLALIPVAANARPDVSRAPLTLPHGFPVWEHRADCDVARFARKDPYGPTWAYRDPRSGIDYRITADRRHLMAVTPAGDVLWRRAPHKGIPNYRVTPACIAGIGSTDGKVVVVEGAYLRRAMRSDPRNSFARNGHYIGLWFDNSQAGYVEIHTGKFVWIGQD